MEALIQHNYDDAMAVQVVVGVVHQLFMKDNAHTHNHMTTIAIASKMSTRKELIDACALGDVEYLRGAAASGVALKTVVDTNFLNGTLLHTASRYDV